MRRIGYILGLLFVGACVAAYALTWGRGTWAMYDRGTNHLTPIASVANGHVMFGIHYAAMDAGSLEAMGLLRQSLPAAPRWADFYTVDVERRSVTIRPGFVLSSYSVVFPLWMPAGVAGVFMAWRWRRRRRSTTTGFPLARAGAAAPR